MNTDIAAEAAKEFHKQWMCNHWTHEQLLEALTKSHQSAIEKANDEGYRRGLEEGWNEGRRQGIELGESRAANASDTPEKLAQQFHETYERLAPAFNYETRKASAKPWAEVPDTNKKLMVAVCAEILQSRAAHASEQEFPEYAYVGEEAKRILRERRAAQSSDDTKRLEKDAYIRGWYDHANGRNAYAEPTNADAKET